MVSTSHMIRAAMASYAASDAGSRYPKTINDFPSLQSTLNPHGSTLINNNLFSVLSYLRFDSDGDGEEESYTMRVAVTDVPNTMRGFQLVLTPTEISLCTATGNPC